MSSRIVRADQVWLGLLQEAHERARSPGLCREHHRARHSTCCVALAARHSSATSRGQQEDRARAPSRGLVLPSPALVTRDASAVTATGRVANQHKQRPAADESYLAASLKVPPPKKKTARTEVASQRKIAQREEAGMTLRLASEISTIFSLF